MWAAGRVTNLVHYSTRRKTVDASAIYRCGCLIRYVFKFARPHVMDGSVEEKKNKYDSSGQAKSTRNSRITTMKLDRKRSSLKNMFRNSQPPALPCGTCCYLILSFMFLITLSEELLNAVQGNKTFEQSSDEYRRQWQRVRHQNLNHHCRLHSADRRSIAALPVGMDHCRQT